MDIDTIRAKLAVKKIKNNKALVESKKFADGAVKSLGQGLEADSKTMVTEFFSRGNVKGLHLTLGGNWLSQGKMSVGYAKESAGRS